MGWMERHSHVDSGVGVGDSSHPHTNHVHAFLGPAQVPSLLAKLAFWLLLPCSINAAASSVPLSSSASSASSV
jgi:hypothetical protein